MKTAKNWLDELVAIACEKVGHKQDHRYQPWAKVVESVDGSKSNGYAFVGPFINDGTVEIEIKPMVFLVKTSSGSRKYQTEYYSVITMDANGDLTPTDIETNSKSRGWALRIRDQVADLVASMSSEPSTLDKLREHLRSMTTEEIVQAALNYYLLHVEHVIREAE